MFKMTRVLRMVFLALTVLCISGFSSYTTVKMTVAGFDDANQALNTVRELVRDLGYSDAEVSHPTPAKSGFRSVEPKGIFIVVNFNVPKGEIEITFSEAAGRFTPAAEKQCSLLVSKLRARFKNDTVTVSEPY